MIQKDAMDIGVVKRQYLKFTTIFGVKSIDGLCIQPSLTFHRDSKMRINQYKNLKKIKRGISPKSNFTSNII